MKYLSAQKEKDDQENENPICSSDNYRNCRGINENMWKLQRTRAAR